MTHFHVFFCEIRRCNGTRQESMNVDKEVKKKKEVHEYRLPHRIVSRRLKLRFMFVGRQWVSETRG